MTDSCWACVWPMVTDDTLAHTHCKCALHFVNQADFYLTCQEGKHFIFGICRFHLELTNWLCDFAYVLLFRCLSPEMVTTEEFLEAPKSRCKLMDFCLASDPSPLKVAIWWEHIDGYRTHLCVPVGGSFFLVSCLKSQHTFSWTPFCPAPPTPRVHLPPLHLTC